MIKIGIAGFGKIGQIRSRILSERNDVLIVGVYDVEKPDTSIKGVFFKSYDDFLVSLKMTAEIKSFSLIYLDRITQLINKTNQFNLTTKRYTANEIEIIFASDE